MGATDGTTPLNAANVGHKASDDFHTGVYTNNGNVVVNDGTLSVTSTGSRMLNPNFVLSGGGYFNCYCCGYESYVIVAGTCYLPQALKNFVPFPGYVDVYPTSFTWAPVKAVQNCTVGTILIGYLTAGHYGCIVPITVTTKSTVSPPAATFPVDYEGYVQVTL